MVAMMQRLSWAPRYGLVLALVLGLPLGAFGQDDTFDFWLSQGYVEQLASENSILPSVSVHVTASTKAVHPLASDCEMHLAATPPDGAAAWPSAIVVEPPNLCKNAAPGTAGWPSYFKTHAIGKDCTATGFPRIFTEHAKSGAAAANPFHVLEIHPALSLKCDNNPMSFAAFLKYYPGMSQIKPATASKCLAERALSVRFNAPKQRYEFRQSGGGTCGNFAAFAVVLNKEWVRTISGGHSAIARVDTDEGTTTLKLYTLDGTAGDAVLAAAQPPEQATLHGLLTYDYFSIIKTLRTADGAWTNPTDWTTVKFPLALVVFGEVE